MTTYKMAVQQNIYYIGLHVKDDSLEWDRWDFDTDQMWIEEADDTISSFALYYNKAEGTYEVYVAWSDDWDISEDVTHLFEQSDLANLQVHFDDVIWEKGVANSYEDYVQFYKEREEEDGE